MEGGPIKNKKNTVYYVTPQQMKQMGHENAFGFANPGNQVAFVRDDLPKRVKEFVEEHELYHLKDPIKDYWAWRELRANLVPGFKDPIGLILTIYKTISDRERIKFYLNRIKKGQ